MDKLIIPQDIFEKIIAHCKSVYPNEACGILSGKNNTVKKTYEVTNIENSSVSYLMDSKEQFQAMKQMRNDCDEMVAIYHSHPNSPAYPSAKDMELAFYSEAVYVIVSLDHLESPDVKAFEISDGNVREKPIELTVSK